jgi:hypothetical protein
MWVPLQVHRTSEVASWLSKHRAMKEYAGVDVQILSLFILDIKFRYVSTFLPLFLQCRCAMYPMDANCSTTVEKAVGLP